MPPFRQRAGNFPGIKKREQINDGSDVLLINMGHSEYHFVPAITSWYHTSTSFETTLVLFFKFDESAFIEGLKPEKLKWLNWYHFLVLYVLCSCIIFVDS
jgi:hypothetical protein